MKRVHLKLSDIQKDELSRLSKQRDIAISEMIRRAIDAYLYEQRKQMLEIHPIMRVQNEMDGHSSTA